VRRRAFHDPRAFAGRSKVQQHSLFPVFAVLILDRKANALGRARKHGERITITVRGKPVAELTPARRTPADAVAEMQAFEPIKGVDPATVADWIEEGRR
jgi:prevent-host-death family protein